MTKYRSQRESVQWFSSKYDIVSVESENETTLLCLNSLSLHLEWEVPPGIIPLLFFLLSKSSQSSTAYCPVSVSYVVSMFFSFTVRELVWYQLHSNDQMQKELFTFNTDYRWKFVEEIIWGQKNHLDIIIGGFCSKSFCRNPVL